MLLRQALSILSKASPYAVKTLTHDNQKSDFDKYKNYLYIETDIEKDVGQALATASKNDIIFVCGSSGDGKSEILVTDYSNGGRIHVFEYAGNGVLEMVWSSPDWVGEEHTR